MSDIGTDMADELAVGLKPPVSRFALTYFTQDRKQFL